MASMPAESSRSVIAPGPPSSRAARPRRRFALFSQAVPGNRERTSPSERFDSSRLPSPFIFTAKARYSAGSGLYEVCIASGGKDRTLEVSAIKAADSLSGEKRQTEASKTAGTKAERRPLNFLMARSLQLRGLYHRERLLPM